VLVSVNPGKTILRALFQEGITVTSVQRIGVFAGTPPLPLRVLDGYVYDGPTVNDGRIDGALVEITAGLLRGATSITGVPPPDSGFVHILGAYSFLDSPPGVMTLRVSKAGYVTVEKEVRFPGNATDLSVQLHR